MRLMAFSIHYTCLHTRVNKPEISRNEICYRIHLVTLLKVLSRVRQRRLMLLHVQRVSFIGEAEG